MLVRRILLPLFLTATSLMAESAPASLPPVLTAAPTATEPGEQMHRYLQGEIDAAWVRWKAGFETRTEASAIQAHYTALRASFIAALGGFPERTPLNARVVGTLERDGYRVEKITFESQPGFVVTAALFLPDARRYAPPYPAVIIPCGHYAPAKAYPDYQSMGALLALNGLAALVYDPIDQGERSQSLDAKGHASIWGTEAHTRAAIKSSLLGLSLARFMIWDGMRALDYLQARPEIDATRLGCTGNSGGGTQTSYLLALDDRIRAAAPSCYITHLAAQTRDAMGDGEQNLHGQVALGLDHPDYLLMRAPVPVKLLAATHDFFPIGATWETFRLAKRAFSRLGASERIDLLENDAGHNYNRDQREAAARWLSRWLGCGDREIHEPELRLFSEEELRCTPGGQVMLLPGARSLHDLLRDAADRAATGRARSWPALGAGPQRDAVRRLAHFRALDQIPPATWSPEWLEERNGYRIESFRVRTAEGIELPAVWFVPAHPTTEPAVVFLSADGFAAEATPGGRLDTLAQSGRLVLALDVRGTGETRQSNQQGASSAVGSDWQDLYRAFLLGRPYVGMQTEDILTAVRAAVQRTTQPQVELVALGGVGVPALHAAFAEPELFRHVTLDHTLRSWDEVARAPRFYQQFMNAVPGALEVYDLPDLAAALGDRLTATNATDPLGWTAGEINGTLDPADMTPDRAGLFGVFYGTPHFSNPQRSDLLPGGAVSWSEAKRRLGGDWAVRWGGTLIPDQTGDITLGVESNIVAVVRVDGHEVARSGAQTGTLPCKPGTRCAIEVDFVKPGPLPTPGGDITTLRLQWKRGDGPWQPVPDSWLRHSRQQEVEIEHLLR